jgi:hypothetical protein
MISYSNPGKPRVSDFAAAAVVLHSIMIADLQNHYPGLAFHKNK